MQVVELFDVQVKIICFLGAATTFSVKELLSLFPFT